MLRTDTVSPLVLDEQTEAFLARVDADPRAPLSTAVQAAGGHGKTAVLGRLRHSFQQAGIAVLDHWRDAADPADPGCAVLVDDAHLLDTASLGELCRLAEAGRARLVVAFRPWPRPAGLADLADLLHRGGPPVLLGPFTEQRTATYLGRVRGTPVAPAVTRLVHEQTGGVPRFVEWLARALPVAADGAQREAGPAGTRASGGPAPGADRAAGPLLEIPRSVLLQFVPELESLDLEVRRLLLALAAGAGVPTDLLGVLLSRGPEEVDRPLAAARASGLLGPDDRLAPLVRRAITTLSPASQRAAVWRRLAELQLQRGGRVLPLVRSMIDSGLGGSCPGEVAEAAGDEALAEDPALAARLFAAAEAAGRPTAARRATAAALAADLDSALRLADRLVASAESPYRAEGAAIAATALVHRGHPDRAVELYRWAGTPSSLAFAALGAVGTGEVAQLDQLLADPPADGPPTLLASAALLMARGLRETLSGPPTAALSTLVQAATLLEPAGRAVLLPESPAALAALVALHCGELDIGERVLDRAVAAHLGAALTARRHRLLQTWLLMVRGRVAEAASRLAAVTAGSTPLESRDLVFAAALDLGIARRTSDLPGLQRGWLRAREAVVRHPVDLFTLLPLGEFAIAAARLGELDRLTPHLDEARALLARLGDPPLWTTPLHWNSLHAAILADRPAVADAHVTALTAAADHSPYAGVLAAAGQRWVEVLRGEVDPDRVEEAARGLHGIGLCWDAARLAGQAAIRTSDRRAMTALLDCARMLQGRPIGGAGRANAAGAPSVGDPAAAQTEGQLSEREREVAELVLGGLTYKQIGDRLFISAKTVEHHVARMRQRLNCASRGELLARLRAITEERPAGQPNGASWTRARAAR
ncbi:helix-turn-helix transcriptional regulator [Micromonospora sp. HM5-17]|jgi:DNA-binding CsgD family transcriptional regulator|uniref:helix-turn-helix transcriptional regulator n=1 Tax=Micromonospora sp. HM5-17 TaxID=2487710 RepID=UPI000F4A9B8F|nr:helix-turn-helix transcriptional regulator [Micromonospora sp. HM5-17]ROT32603.1 LuxR family transcriptional regulator [Micromonospora sp. HM5-17]